MHLIQSTLDLLTFHYLPLLKAFSNRDSILGQIAPVQVWDATLRFDICRINLALMMSTIRVIGRLRVSRIHELKDSAVLEHISP